MDDQPPGLSIDPAIAGALDAEQLAALAMELLTPGQVAALERAAALRNFPGAREVLEHFIIEHGVTADELETWVSDLPGRASR